MDNFAEDLDEVYRGKKSIAKAIKELDVVKQAFKRSARVEVKVSEQEQSILEIRRQIELISSAAFVNSKNTEFYYSVESIVNSKINDFAMNFTQELNKKINETDLKRQMDTKVPWTEFLALKHNLIASKMKLDKYLEVEVPLQQAKFESSLIKSETGTNNNADLAQKLSAVLERVERNEEKIGRIERKAEKETKKAKANEIDLHRKKIFQVIEDNGGNFLCEKIEDIDKEINRVFDQSMNSQSRFLYIKELFRVLIREIKRVKDHSACLERLQKEQESRFIEIIRTKDLQNQMRKDKVKFEKVPAVEIERLKKELNEKNNRIAMIESGFNYVATELEFIKKKFTMAYKNKEAKSKEITEVRNDFKKFRPGLNESLSKPVSEPTELTESRIPRLSNTYNPPEDSHKSLTPILARLPTSKFTDRSSPRLSRNLKSNKKLINSP